jgi:hypothetical protein
MIWWKKRKVYRLLKRDGLDQLFTKKQLMTIAELIVLQQDMVIIY